VLKGFIPDRASFSQEILAFSWLLQETMSDRDFSENALFSKLFRLLCEITFGNLLSPDFSPGEWHRAAWRVIGGVAPTTSDTDPRQPDGDTV
jgi:hypothetical protein